LRGEGFIVFTPTYASPLKGEESMRGAVPSKGRGKCQRHLQQGSVSSALKGEGSRGESVFVLLRKGVMAKKLYILIVYNA